MGISQNHASPSFSFGASIAAAPVNAQDNDTFSVTDTGDASASILATYIYDEESGQWLNTGGSLPSLVVEKMPLYEYRDIWAEESGGTSANSAEWSFGNGATGFMGLPFDDGWEITALYFMADTFAATASITVAIHNHRNVASNSTANDLASITLANAADGGGQTNNAAKFEDLTAPVPVPANSVLGFITRSEAGNISDARIGARLRRQVGEYVSDVDFE